MPEPAEMPATSPRRRRWLRLSLRGLMLLVLRLGGGLGYAIQRARSQRAALAALRGRLDIVVDLQWQRCWPLPQIDHRSTTAPQPLPPPAPPAGAARPAGGIRWLGWPWIGRYYYEYVEEARLGGDATDVDLARIARLPGLRRLWLDGAGLTDAGLAHLAGLPDLEDLRLGLEPPPSITGVGLAALAGLPRLKSLTSENGRIDDAGLAAPVKLPALKQVDVSQTKVTAAGAARARRARPGLMVRN